MCTMKSILFYSFSKKMKFNIFVLIYIYIYIYLLISAYRGREEGIKRSKFNNTDFSRKIKCLILVSILSEI